MKKLISLLLVICMLCSLCACGGSTYGIKILQTMVEQEYSLAFRNDDPMYFYISGAIEVLAANGTVDQLSRKWFGDNVVSFTKNAAALDNIAVPEGRTLTIGADTNSFPMIYASNDTYWGFDIEMAIAVTDLLGWELAVQPIEKENVYIELMSGNIDVAWGGIALNQDELSKGLYTQYGPYIKNDIVVAARDSAGIWNKLKLSGKNMAMPTTVEATDALNTDEKLVRRLGQITRLAGGTMECFEYLYSGKCDIILTDSTAVYYYNCH